MDGAQRQDRRYAAVLLAFLAGLVTIGLLGVPALLVAAGGAVVAAVAIFALRGSIEAERASAGRPAIPPRRISRQYVPSVLESSSTKRRRGVQRRRRPTPGRPLKIR